MIFILLPGNTYFIENICNRDARLFFTQARKMEMSPEEQKRKSEQVAEAKRRHSGRSSSVGATPSARVRVPNGRAASMAVFPSAK